MQPRNRRSFFALLAGAIAAPLAALGVTRKIPAQYGCLGRPWLPVRPLSRFGWRTPYAPLDPTGTTDARVWAKAFVTRARACPLLGTDEMSMLAWFASAIEEGRDAGRRNAPWKADYDRACQTIAEMHQAAMGEVCGPRRGVVEDVEDLRRERDHLRQQHGGWQEFRARLSDHLRRDPPQKSS